MRAIEALEAMKQGLKVCLHWPDCEMYQLVEKNRIEVTLVGFGDKPSDVCSPNMFLKSFDRTEFVLYEDESLEEA